MTANELSELNSLIERARHYKMNQEEIEEQSLNWVIGNAPEGPRPSEAEVREALYGLPV